MGIFKGQPWHEVEASCKWLETTLETSAYEGKPTMEIIKSFAETAKKIVTEIFNSNHKEPKEEEEVKKVHLKFNRLLPTQCIVLQTQSCNNLEITGDDLFTQLSRMIADILAACLTNIPKVVTMRCHENAIEKREASVMAAINLLGRTTEIIKKT
ncbi:hypothetical protein L1987_41710 [Smallanthus sonchifolius]|uniref:Uncharacterized protein n=1 Tax=Smallanthus sonchifolius TaxID=185202 RepID=A0ACB9GW79_9ASTR|nr:hypothetical protein L1987_41710 [Smallanthus sonchifolius]